MKFLLNENGQQEANFSAKLISISDRVFENKNGKEYKVATIEFKDVNNETQRSSALVYEGNYKYGMEIGKSYLSTATLTEQGVIVRVSHLEGSANKPSANMFGFEVTVDSVAAVNETAIF